MSSQFSLESDGSGAAFEHCALSNLSCSQEGEANLLCSEVITSESQSQDVDVQSERSLDCELDFLSDSSEFKRKRGDWKRRSRGGKRRKNTLSTASDAVPTCAHTSQTRSQTAKKLLAPLLVEKVEIPESSSLFLPFSATWILSSPSKEVDLSKSFFTLIPNPTSKNGIWLKLNANMCQREIFLFIELFERRINSKEANSDQLVQFCQNGVCSSKRNDVIELRGKRIDAQGDQKDSCQFEATFAINEQCAHRSDNGYGSPNVRFFFKFQLCEKVAEQKAAKTISMCHSPLIKVVAPGKNKDHLQKVVNVSKKGSKAKKVTVKQMFETILLRMQEFEDKLQTLEGTVAEQQKQIQQQAMVQQQAMFQNVPMAYDLSDPALQLKSSFDATSLVLSPRTEHGVKQELLNAASEESMQCLSRYLNFSQ